MPFAPMLALRWILPLGDCARSPRLVINGATATPGSELLQERAAFDGDGGRGHGEWVEKPVES